MASFKNRHLGEVATIVANGPGLKTVPLDFLYAYPTFAANYISLLDGFIPTYLTVGDAEAVVGDVPEESKDYYEVTQEPDPERMALIEPKVSKVDTFFVLHTIHKHFKSYQNARPIYNVKAACFSYSPIRYLFTGGTMTYTNLQLAFYMGFRGVFIVGLDHDYSRARHFSDDEYLTTARTEEENQRNTLAVMEKSYGLAREAYDVAERPILNVSHFSKCRSFKRARPPWLLTGHFDIEDIGRIDKAGTN